MSLEISESLAQRLDQVAQRHGLTTEEFISECLRAMDRKELHQIKSQNLIFERMIDSLPVMIMIVDSQRSICFTNQTLSQGAGYTLVPPLRLTDTPFPLDQISEHYRHYVEAILEQPENIWVDREIQFDLHHSQRMSWLKLRLANSYTVLIGQDIEHRVKLEQELLFSRQLELELAKERELRELKDNFVAMITHEYRTPLAIISTSAGMLARYADRLTDADVRAHIAKIEKQVQHQVELLNDAVTFANQEAGVISFHPQKVDFIPFCEEIMTEIGIIDTGGHQLVMDRQFEPGVIAIDPNIFRRILIGLLSNAIKYSPPGTTVTLGMRRTVSQLILTVADQGIGMSKRDQERIFEPFFRGEKAGLTQGTGLGLAIVNQLVEAHGGMITFDSAPNQGTTFIMRFPLRFVGIFD